MRCILPAGAVVLVLAACGVSNPPPKNPNDKSGGATSMQPGSGGTYQDVQRTQDGATERSGSGDTAQPTGVNPPPEPSTEPKSPPPPPRDTP